jgi:hypothetical protein
MKLMQKRNSKEDIGKRRRNIGLVLIVHPIISKKKKSKQWMNP